MPRAGEESNKSHDRSVIRSGVSVLSTATFLPHSVSCRSERVQMQPQSYHANTTEAAAFFSLSFFAAVFDPEHFLAPLSLSLFPLPSQEPHKGGVFSLGASRPLSEYCFVLFYSGHNAAAYCYYTPHKTQGCNIVKVPIRSQVL